MVIIQCASRWVTYGGRSVGVQGVGRFFQKSFSQGCLFGVFHNFLFLVTGQSKYGYYPVCLEMGHVWGSGQGSDDFFESDFLFFLFFQRFAFLGFAIFPFW